MKSMKMKRINDLSLMETEVFSEIKTLISKTSSATRENPSNLTEGINILGHLRKDIYEDLNQIQHEAMILRAAKLIGSNDYRGKNVVWYWNPKQTGSKKEPDLLGKIAGKTVVLAEITTSEKPSGGIDKRIAHALQKLEDVGKKSRRIFFVRTQEMRRRAETKAQKKGFKIEIKII